MESTEKLEKKSLLLGRPMRVKKEIQEIQAIQIPSWEELQNRKKEAVSILSQDAEEKKVPLPVNFEEVENNQPIINSELTEGKLHKRGYEDSGKFRLGALPNPPTLKKKPLDSQRINPLNSSLIIGSEALVDGLPYKIVREIGKGGTSTVFCALREDTSNQKDALVALKHVVGSENVEALKQEIALLEKLKGIPQVIQLISHEVSNSIGIIVMELGQTDISQCISELTFNRETGKRDTPINRNTIRYFFEGMVEAVQAIHQCRIVHGDLKPANFVFVRGKVKLIDFGIAKSIRDDTINITRESQTGTMNYIPPEALMETSSNVYKLSCKADVWSLGCILYSLVYGHPPFQDIQPIGKKIYAITNPAHEIRFPLLNNNNGPDPLLDALKRCLQREIEKRISISDLLSHPFITCKPLLPQVSASQKGLLLQIAKEFAVRASEVKTLVESNAARANRLAAEFLNGFVHNGNGTVTAENIPKALTSALIKIKENLENETGDFAG